MDFYVRQFRDMKVIPDAGLIAPVLGEFATACGAVLARSHARTGDPVAIGAYIGKGRRFDEAMRAFANGYADQTERDHAQLVRAIADGIVPAEEERLRCAASPWPPPPPVSSSSPGAPPHPP